VPVEEHGSPAEAFAAAFAAADPVDRIVVFGSFYNVGSILANGLPQRSGRHTA
jgi:dihydrofolate synthase / folylpolyglutamate synthase